MRKIASAVLALGTVLLLAPAAVAQTPSQDSVTGSGTAFGFGTFLIDARSGPNGENPVGQASADGFVGLAGPITCLAVAGRTAVFNVSTPSFPGSDTITFQVTDNAGLGQPDGMLALTTGGVGGRPPMDCSPISTGLSATVLTGDISVVDAQRLSLPTSKGQCKNGGWKTYGVFKNQGDCVSFVATKGKNQPSDP
jgi:hypothetical protein